MNWESKMDIGANILATPAAFEEYCAAISESLTQSREKRMEFLGYAVERLEKLENTARLLSQTDVSAQVGVHLEAARQELEQLRNVSSGDPW